MMTNQLAYNGAEIITIAAVYSNLYTRKTSYILSKYYIME